MKNQEFCQSCTLSKCLSTQIRPGTEQYQVLMIRKRTLLCDII